MTASRSAMTALRTSRGSVSYQVELSHAGLHRHRLVRGPDAAFVERTVALQIAEWDEQWERRQSISTRHRVAQQKQNLAAEHRQFAEEKTSEANEVLDRLGHTLQTSLSGNHVVDWNSLKPSESFPEPTPTRPDAPPRPVLPSIRREPRATDAEFEPKLSIIDKLISSRAERKVQEASEAFAREHDQWCVQRDSVQREHKEAERRHADRVAQQAAAFEERARAWKEAREEFAYEQQQQTEAVDRQHASYLAGDAKAIEGYCDLVLSRSEYPDFMPKEWEIDYISETKVLVVDYSLPSPEAIPTLTEVKYVVSKNELAEKHLSALQLAKIYDDLVYQITLRTLHELFAADIAGVLAMVTFNGYVKSIDKATGQSVNPCVLSLQAAKTEFSNINLAQVDPRACFKSMRGVGSSKLHSMSAIAPIMNIRREDGRFIAAHDVAYQLDDSYNLAAMDWEEFEQLIRELFEQEFAVNGGEVKVTRASRDGGVDAVAFDPDPIRGGKIVIQAKRYTNTVGVAAVRDLYGTVMNEGATKGILVTTSDYGPDAYAFIANKPLTLLNGANLLHLLQKHGHRAKIDIQAARLMAMQQKVGDESSD